MELQRLTKTSMVLFSGAHILVGRTGIKERGREDEREECGKKEGREANNNSEMLF